MLIPVFGFLKGDTIGLVILVQDTDRIKDLAASLQDAAAVRVAPQARAFVYAHGQLLDSELTIAQAGITALDRVDVVGVDISGVAT